MSTPGPADIAADVAGVRDAHAALVSSLVGLDDATARAPSRLAGWSVGHVLTHLARNAESFVRVLSDAAGGRVGVQYPGGQASRDADIEAGSTRSASELLDDLSATDADLEAALDGTSEEIWATGRARRGELETPVAFLPLRRLQEVEIHRVDLGLGYEPEDWPDRFVARETALVLGGLAHRLPPGVAVELVVDAGPPALYGDGSETVRVARPAREVLEWLVGRSSDPALPVLGPW
ncbi:MAG: maleylpyruvate isomerase family mycothiol-dependent enzyme [Actinomycetota bacterium]|nr:maleylpyruvate isomerase family mycothiol-dependent enzyme [Actinomycetota bacterium]